MAEICCDVVSENKASTECEPVTRAARRRRMEIRRFKFVANVASPLDLGRCKRQKIEAPNSLLESEDYQNSLLGSAAEEQKQADGGVEAEEEQNLNRSSGEPPVKLPATEDICPKFGFTSVCGRRREMEDAVSIHPSFLHGRGQISARFHFFGVYDGHGCSHVAMSCKERLHTLVAEELGNEDAVTEWKAAMERSFSRMGSEVAGGGGDGLLPANCRCEMQTPQCDAVGSTAVIAVVGPDKVVVANCGDSRAVLCRNGKAIPLSSDHKPDRPDELLRIQAAGGRVIYWDGPRVLGVLAMSRAIGDYYLKPYVTSEPEVTVTDRTSDDEFMILASDGLWDVISNDTACNIVRMCLRGHHAPPSMGNDVEAGSGNGSDRACTDASMLLTKLALARHSTDNVTVVVVDLTWDSRTL